MTSRLDLWFTLCIGTALFHAVYPTGSWNECVTAWFWTGVALLAHYLCIKQEQEDISMIDDDGSKIAEVPKNNGSS